MPLVGRLEEFPKSSIERSGEALVVQYRHRILPLVLLRKMLDGEAAPDAGVEDSVSVIVFEDEKRQLGVVVDQIVDIAEQAITIRQQLRQSCFLGSAVVGSHVTEFLDVEQLLRRSVPEWFQTSSPSLAGKRVLLGDGSAFARGLLRGSLEMNGYTVREVSNLGETLRALEQHGADAVLVSRNLPPHGAQSVIQEMRSRPEWSAIPVLELTPGSDCLAELSGDGRPGSSIPGQVLTFLGGLSNAASPEIADCVGKTRSNL